MRVVVLAVDGMFDSGLTVVLDVLEAANALRDDTSSGFQVELAGLGQAVRTAHGLSVGTTPVDSLAEPPDVVVTPAVGLRTATEVVRGVRDHPALGWLRHQAGLGAQLAAACSGTFFLAEAGLLDGRRATTSWWLGAGFRARYPKVRLDDRLTLAEDAEVTTAGAAFAHIDLALALVARQSPDLATRVSRHLLLGERASQAAFAIPSQLAASDPAVLSLERWVRAHLGEPIRISQAAADIGMSERALQRATARVLGMSPLDFAHEICIDHALHLLRTTDQTPESVALAVGYANVGSLRSLVRKRRGATLTELIRGGRPLTVGG